ncbi:hypothetical protein MAR_ORF022 [Marseillevirus marseillevirus]|uniref:Uncharacterized protein n=1 Tax=Marseillevirus marseillevirus TaxID=694581 RepID=D2XA38_GBMV|nr:hypothetical protein MAR_ORF022 [Marseillevirus marseillevirus]ADB03815.1 hypothetical protein MAR_ORF022 [Marseillevirus marseillevirus]
MREELAVHFQDFGLVILAYPNPNSEFLRQPGVRSETICFDECFDGLDLDIEAFASPVAKPKGQETIRAAVDFYKPTSRAEALQGLCVVEKENRFDEIAE